MGNKRENNLLDIASKLDAITSSNGQITKLAVEIVENKDDEATREIFRRISVLMTEESKQVAKISQILKNEIVNYYGYLRVREICNGNSSLEIEEEKSLDELLQELNELVGLDNVKSKVNDLIAYQRIQKLRENEGLHSQKNTLHLAFTGNPGTGKTTVARVVGRIYKQIGLLSKGHFIEVSRTDLIAGYQGQTALKVKEVIERAKGGVLFIDEAYSITENDHTDSYGRECLTELTKALEDYREDLVVIVAGYTEPMKQFFESNPGLKSRFNTFIEFEDYDSYELELIMEMICKKNNYVLTGQAILRVKEIIQQSVLSKGKEFANGRFIRNLYEAAVMNHARRVNKIAKPSREDLMNVLDEDIILVEKEKLYC